jgi:hypothetical protein
MAIVALSGANLPGEPATDTSVSSKCKTLRDVGALASAPAGESTKFDHGKCNCTFRVGKGRQGDVEREALTRSTRLGAPASTGEVMI